MFDITNREIREQKLKFIEILLIVGGIIGGLRLQDKNDLINIVFGLFLIGSLLYYITISNNKINSNALTFAIASASFGFSAIAILPFILQGISLFYSAFIMILWFVLSVLIYRNLER
jgi:uncharacterized membrane protein (UPF0136 family)